MSGGRAYALHSDDEPARLDRQARVIGIEQFLDHILTVPNGRILDAGCGSGSMARLLARELPHAGITGLDIREPYLDYARRKAAEEELANLTFAQGSLLDLPFPTDSFDVVWACLVLHWLSADSLERAMAELSRVVRPGGWIVCAEPDGVGTNHYPMPPDLLQQWSTVTSTLFDPDMGRRLQPLMHGAGLEDIRVEIRPYFFHAFGAIDPAIMEVIGQALEPAIPRVGEILGGIDKAQLMLDRLKTFLGSAETVSYPLWFIAKGRNAD